MEQDLIKLYKFQDNNWIKTAKFGPQDIICVIFSKKNEIWVWNGPLTSSIEKNQAFEKLKQWKLIRENDKYFYASIKTGDWRRSRIIQNKFRIGRDQADQICNSYQFEKIKDKALLIPLKSLIVLNLFLYLAIFAVLLVNKDKNLWMYTSFEGMLDFPEIETFTKHWIYPGVIALLVLFITLLEFSVILNFRRTFLSLAGSILTASIGFLVFWLWPIFILTGASNIGGGSLNSDLYDLSNFTPIFIPTCLILGLNLAINLIILLKKEI